MQGNANFRRYERGSEMDTREQWLMRAVDALRPHFTTNGFSIPGNVKATCGFPSRGGLSQRKRTIGQCWDSTQSKGDVFEIFISPTIADHVEVLAVLAHECVHATVGLKCGHKAPFKRCAQAIGLTGKMTATEAGDSFKRFAADALPGLGGYPHAVLNASSRIKTQSARLIKCMCGECGYTARTTRIWLDGAGAPICPACNVVMEEI